MANMANNDQKGSNFTKFFAHTHQKLNFARIVYSIFKIFFCFDRPPITETDPSQNAKI